jgi:hypothetical protein
LIVSLQAGEKLSLEQIRGFLEGSEEVRLEGRNREEIYGWANQPLRQPRYEELNTRPPHQSMRWPTIASPAAVPRSSVNRTTAL